MSDAADQGAAGAGASADAGAGGAGAGTATTGAAASAGKAADGAAAAGAADAGKGTEVNAVSAKDGQAGAAKDGDGKGKEGEQGKDAAAPVDYGKVIAEVQMPEGMTLDPAAAKLGGELFAKHNLSPEVVKDLVSLYAQQQKAGADGNAKAFADQVTGWKADAEKSTTAEERGTAKDAALKVFGKDEVALLEHFGVTNRGGFIKAMAKIGKAIVSDDSYVPGNAGGAGEARDARSHFPKSNMNP